MITVRKQEFVGMFLLGLILVLIGVLGYVIQNNIVDIIAAAVYSIYWIATVVLRMTKKPEKDDEASIQNRYKAGYMTFIGMLTSLMIAIIVCLRINSNRFSLSFPIRIELRTLCIITGLALIVYYCFFIHFEKEGE